MADTIGTYYFQLAPSTEGISESISSALGDAGEKSGKSFAGTFGKVMGTTGAVIGTITAAVGGISTALVGATNSVATYGDDIDKMSQKMGISAEAYQEWDAVMQHSGTSIDGLKMGIKKINEDLSTAPSMIEDYYEELYSLKDAFNAGAISQEEYSNSSSKLGDALYDSLGGIGELAKTAGLSIDTIEQMAQDSDFALETVISTLQGMPEGAQRAALATDVLGRSAMELGALFNTSAEDTQAMRDRVHELGGVMSDEAVKSAAAFQDQLQDMQTASQSLVRNMMSDFLPGITEVMGGLTDLFAGDTDLGLEKITAGVDDVISKVTDKLPEFMEIGSHIVLGLAKSILENAPKIVSTGISIITDLILEIGGMLPEIVNMASSLIVEIVNSLSAAAPVLIPAVIEAVMNTIDALISNLPLILSSILEFVKILVTSILEDGLPLLISRLPDIIMGVINFILSAIPQIIQAVISIVKAIAENLPLIIQQIVDVLPDLITSVIDAILSNLPLFIECGIELFVALVEALPQIIVAIVGAIPQIIQAIGAALVKEAPKMAEMGSKLLKSLADGLGKIGNLIGNAIYKVWTAIKTGLENHINGIKQIGANILTGLVEGIKSKITAVVDTVKTVAGKISDGFKDFFGIHSPSKLFTEYGQFIDEGLAEGITGGEDMVNSAMDGLNGAMVSDIESSLTVDTSREATPTESGLYDLLATYLPYLAQRNDVNVTLEGNADGIFNLVKRANNEFKKQNGRSAFA